MTDVSAPRPKELNYNLLDCAHGLLSERDVNKQRESQQWLLPWASVTVIFVSALPILYHFDCLGCVVSLCVYPLFAAFWNSRITPKSSPSDYLNDSEAGRRLLARGTELLVDRVRLFADLPPRGETASQVAVHRERVRWETAWRIHVEKEWQLKGEQDDVVGKLVSNSDDPTIH